MIYRVEKVLSSSIVAYVDAESKEEAIKKAENDDVVRDAKVKAFRNQFRGVSDIPFFIYRLKTIFA